jgi:hypothetical protein
MNWLRSPWVSGGLAVVAVAFVAFQVLTSGRSRGRPATVVSAPAATAPALTAPAPAAAQPKASPSVAVPPPATVTAGQIPIDRRFVQSRLAEWIDGPRRDPFFNATHKAARAEPSPVAGWKLSAIWRQTGSRVATINGSIYQEGDEIEGYKIERIEGDQVWFRGPTGREPLGFTSSQTETNAVPKSTNAAARPGGTKKPYRALPLIED